MQNYGYQQSNSYSQASPAAPAQAADRELGWEEEFSGVSDWEPLPEGDYPFRVEALTRKRWGGADWLPACNAAELTIRIFGDQEITLKHTLYLHTRRLYAMKHFFVSIGQAQESDEVIRPRWQEVPGAEGMCHVVPHEYQKKDGTTGKTNRIQRFLPPVQAAERKAPAAPQTAQTVPPAVSAPAAAQGQPQAVQQGIPGYNSRASWRGAGF